MTAVMLLLLLAVTLIMVAVLAWYSRNRTRQSRFTLHNAVLTHQSYADAGGIVLQWSKRHYSKAYDTAQRVEAKARDWIHAESLQLNVQSSLPKRCYPTVVAGLAA